MVKRLTLNQYFYKVLLVGVVVCIVLGPSSCKTSSEETNLPFETVEQKEWPGIGKPYESYEPNLMVISGVEVDNLKGLISNEAMEKLQTMDYDNFFAILVLQGLRPSTGYKVDIARVTRLENTVNIYADFLNPQPGMETASVQTSPYHLVQVQKAGNWGQDITFNLIVNKTPIVSLSHTIP